MVKNTVIVFVRCEMDPKKPFPFNNDSILKDDIKKRREMVLSDGVSRIASYYPFEGMQIIFYDVHTPDMPDLWQMEVRKSCSERYQRTLVCKSGSCKYTVNKKSGEIHAGQVVLDYGDCDDGSFFFTCDDFSGVEVCLQGETLTRESKFFQLVYCLLSEMRLPGEEIYNADGYVYSYSRSSEQTLERLLEAGLDGTDGVMLTALSVELGYNLATDLKNKQSPNKPDAFQKKLEIAEDIRHCLSDDFSTKYTAAYFAEKYKLSLTTVKKYFRDAYGYGFKEYQIKVRMEWAKRQLAQTNMKVGEISERVGYSNQTKFTNLFKKYYGVTPMQYRKENRHIG